MIISFIMLDLSQASVWLFRDSIDINDDIAYNASMATSPDMPRSATLNIRQLDPALKEQLRIRAAHNGRSMEAEARAILREVLMADRSAQAASGAELVAAIRRRFAPLGGVALDLPPRGPGREPPRFE